ncbi:hypothetical protein [Shimia sp. SDUM112013]|uniref:COG4223 family protein n=1 Tax=Shimia sp. SDUM112013 TaxID=3136160 RepID=UPI0032EC6E75
MAKSDKTGKPEKAEKDAKRVEDIVDAEIVEEVANESDPMPTDEATADEQKDDVAPDEAPDAVDLKEPTTAELDDVKDQGASESEPEEVKATDQVPEAEEPPTVTVETETAHVSVSSDAPQEVQKVGFFRVALGGVVAAALGFGVATYMNSQGMLPGGGSSAAIEALQAELAKQEARLADLSESQGAISGTVDTALEQAAMGAEASAKLAEITAQVESLNLLIVQLEDRVVTAEKRPMTEGASAAAIAAYEAEVAQLREMVADQLAEAEQLKERSEVNAQQTLARAALARIVSGLDSGVPYRSALVDLGNVSGVAVPPALEANADTGVPTLLILAEAYPDYAREALADARSQETQDGGGSLTGFLKKQLGARSVTPKEGDDADAILSRAEAAVREGRLSAALTELESLPASSQALMSEWRQMAETRIAAQDAVEELSNSLMQN